MVVPLQPLPLRLLGIANMSAMNFLAAKLGSRAGANTCVRGRNGFHFTSIRANRPGFSPSCPPRKLWTRACRCHPPKSTNSVPDSD